MISTLPLHTAKFKRVEKMAKPSPSVPFTKIQVPRVVMDCLLNNSGELIKSVRDEAKHTTIKCDAIIRQIIFQGPKRQKAMMIMYGKLDRRKIRFNE